MSSATKAAGPNGGPNRRRASTTKQPTLLSDFLLGRPSPARIAAERQAARERRKSLELVKQEMRQASIQRIQAPGGVRDRVKKWQKENAEAMATADPLAPPTEPSEVNIQVDEESVTEQDRERIKWRRRKLSQPKPVVFNPKPAVSPKPGPARQGPAKQGQGSPEKAKADQETSKLNDPPKKRVVSDTNWVKNAKNKNPASRSQSPKMNQNGSNNGSPIPKDFLQRTSANPSVSKKVQAWASKVEIPSDSPPHRHNAARSVGSGDGIRIKSMASESDVRSSKSDSTRIVVEKEPKRPQKAKISQDDGIRVNPVRKKAYYDDGIRVKSMASEGDNTSTESDSTRIINDEPKKSEKGKEPEDSGIRGKPLRRKVYHDDGIRVQPSHPGPSNDGIRIYPSSEGSRSTSTLRAPSKKTSRDVSGRVTDSRKESRDSAPLDRPETAEGSGSKTPTAPTRRPSRRRSNQRRSAQKKPMPTVVSDVHTATTGTTDTGTTITSTTQTGTFVTNTTQTGTDATGSTQTGTTVTEDVSDSASWTGSSDGASDRASTGVPSQLADIPVGYSAFSVLDLSGGAKGQNAGRPKTNRQTSFKGATNALRKVLTEGKKMVTEKVDPPKPVVNQPPSIENWLKGTVDPFVEGSSKPEPESHHRRSTEKEWSEQSKVPRSTSPTPKQKLAESKPAEARPVTPAVAESQEPVTPEVVVTQADHEEVQEEEKEPTTPSSAGLKRSRATRVSSSPLRSSAAANTKKGFKDKLRDAFRGESTGHSYMPPPEYPSCSTIVDLEDNYEDDHRHLRSPFSDRRDLPLSDDGDSVISSEPSSLKPPPLNPKRKPPTNGHYELSTIASEQSRSTQESDMSSIVSESTVTGTTPFTRSTTGTKVSRQRSNKSGLKRRLTKHSDLVSALSLTDDGASNDRGNNLRSMRSVRRASTNLHHATVENLLREFAADENLYQRELKTVVDGVVPVLLTQVIHGEEHTHKDLFGSPSAKPRQEMLSKAVVDMGVMLEKLRNSHKRCPLLDVHRLPQWLESVHGIYDRYLDVWRLGFQGVIVNLAPAMLDDNDSLINAMPRNEEGDVLNEDGERIDVAHLLKRPLVRIKWISKFIKGYRSVTGTGEYESLASRWETLQDKARKRHREETARAVDDDATYTDTSRVRDLQTLEVLDNVKIDRHRQVYAKDTFSLDLRHSSGQRLVCQIELISRDNPLFKSDVGDLLIREIGNGGRSWLLFAPIIGGYYSARKGDDAYQLVVMVRGHRDEWYELLTLAADDKEQILEWLDILGSDPMPPQVKRGMSRQSRMPAPSPRSSTLEVPLGERQLHQQYVDASPQARTLETLEGQHTTPERYHTRVTSLPATPTSHSPPLVSPETTPTQEYVQSRPPVPAYPPPVIPPPTSAPPAIPAPTSPPPAPPVQAEDDDRSHPLHESMRPEPLTLRKTSSPNSTPFRQDGAPPPPVHRTFSQKSPNLAPPPKKSSGRLKRRTSSPLKHEYHPSDISTDASSSLSETDDDYDENYDNYDQHDDGYDYDDESVTSDSSDDELEAADIPDTVPAISVKPRLERTRPESLVSESQVSITPSASASHAGPTQAHAQVPQYSDNVKTPEYALKSLANISYWDNKHGCWKDLWPDVCSIVTTPGLIEAYPYQRIQTSSGGSSQGEDRPLIALDLTPLVMLRNSTVLDLEIRSPVLSYARLYSKITKMESSFFRFRAPTFQECENLYLAVHRARMDNAKYKALEEETRIRSFGQQQAPTDDGDGSSRHRGGWFGRKNSYRASARAPSQSAGSISLSSTMSASSFLKRLMGGHQSFNIAMSSIDRQSSRPGSVGGDPSLYGPSSASTPRSPSVSAAHSGSAGHSLTTNNLKIRLHLLVSASKWEDHGNCLLEVARPDPGARQNLRKYQGMEKRVIVRTINKKHPEKEKVVLDVVLGSRCFSRLGSRGVLLNVWEENSDGADNFVVRDRGNVGGQVSKWCFQCAGVAEASWIFGLVTQEVMIG
ncbi:hypothetical protein SLS62_009712 [Diatrype stigma]|uniref:Uncharacterized protein n=1 Tax=Diatrype stigma TaxID=117547 RepID=A0AAN9YIT7_9PEZI